MSNKSQLNQLSKREILESLLSRQQQDSSSMNRLILSIAVAAGIEPEKIAETFADGEVTKTFAERFNKALDVEFQKREQSTTPVPSDSLPSTDEVTEVDSAV